MVERYRCIAVLEGTSELDAEPVLVTDDPELMGAIVRAIAQRLGAGPEAPRVLRLVEDHDVRGGDGAVCPDCPWRPPWNPS